MTTESDKTVLPAPPTGWSYEDAALWRLFGPRGCRCLRQEELLAMGDEALVRELGRLEAPLCDLTTAQLRVVLRCFRARESREEGLTAERLERLLVRYGYTFKLLCREDRGAVSDTQYVALYDERKTLIHVVCVERAGLSAARPAQATPSRSRSSRSSELDLSCSLVLLCEIRAATHVLV